MSWILWKQQVSKRDVLHFRAVLRPFGVIIIILCKPPYCSVPRMLPFLYFSPKAATGLCQKYLTQQLAPLCAVRQCILAAHLWNAKEGRRPQKLTEKMVIKIHNLEASFEMHSATHIYLKSSFTRSMASFMAENISYSYISPII